MRAKRIPKLQQNTGFFSDLRVLSTPVHTQRFVLITRGRKGPQRYFNGNIMGDKLLLNFDAKFQRKLIIYTRKRTKLQWQRSVRFSAKMASRFQNVMNKDVRALKDDLENLNTRKRTSRRILPVFCRKILKLMNLIQNVGSAVFSACSSRSIR